MAETNLHQRIEAVRRFNRFYTRQIGVLQEGLLESRFSLAEARILYELAHRQQPTASALAQDLGLDPGYLSRILRRFQKQGLVTRQPSPADRRQQLLSLTEQGQQAFAPLNTRSHEQIGAMLSQISADQQREIIAAMQRIERLLGSGGEPGLPYLLRAHQPGDMGWIVHRHGLLYAQEYGWNDEFEALVAKIVAGFLEHYDPQRERCWIAEREGAIAGSVFLVKKADQVAQLRLLLVEPSARGLGIGRRLVQECGRFARQAGYQKIVLWTNSVLTGARRIYEQAGYRMVDSEPHHSFGHDLVGENWELELSSAAR
jgi:DNA-binding MarR family transcriptional regulator/N-acetylglutamate synthase-like GNAT family acetyltransferase